MTFSFVPGLPAGINSKPVLISGKESSDLPAKIYLLYTDDEFLLSVFEIRYEFHCSPFNQAMIAGDLLAVGFEDYFYLYSLSTNKNLLRLPMEGYFCHLYSDKGLLFITDAGGLYCIDKNAHLAWQNNNLGIDGVLINSITDDKIFGSGEWDPPGGWRDFILNKEDGTFV
jgi:hypothetical protein